MEYALVLLWFLAFQALAFAALPLASRLFPRFPDRGAAFALPVALVVVTAVGYWIGHVAFGRWTAFLGVGVLSGLSLLVLWDGGPFDSDGREEVDLRGYAEAAVVFAIAFGLLLAVRAVDPSIHPGGGEKFLDYGIFKSLMRADELPPADMWWAGEHILYYYGGHLVSALLTNLTGTPPRYAYNLALSGFYATLVTAAYGLAAAMADARDAPRRTAGALGGFFVGFAGNLVTPVAGAIWLLPESVARPIANRVAATLAEPNAGKLVRQGLDEFNYWAPSRVIPQTINEFPLFGFLNGDLHAHMTSTPFMLLVAALGFAYYRSRPEALRRRRALAFGALPLTVGLLGFVNVWSFPTGLGVVWLALVFAPADPLSLFPGLSSDERAEPVTDGGVSPRIRLLTEARRVAAAFAAAFVVAAVAVAVISPFVGGILLKSASNRSIGFLPTPASASALALVHGAFLLVFGLYLWPRARSAFDVETVRFGVLAGLFVLLSWTTGYAVLALVVPVLAVGWLLLRARGGTGVGYETALMVAGAGLVTLVEFVYVKENAAPERMNTVFKVYEQVWVLWGTAAGTALASLVASAGPSEWRIPSLGLSRSGVMSGLALLLVVSTAMYGALALSGHFTSGYNRLDDPTLNGTAYVQDDHPQEAAAIRWLDDRKGQPHIVSPPGKQVYTWTSPASSLTGLPTVVGWVYHEGIYRGHETAQMRAADVKLIYTGQWADRMELLKKYDVEYIYVGPRARERYDRDDLQFSEFPGIEKVFEKKGVVIYRVRSE